VTEALVAGSGLVRVSVVAGERRVDLALPGAVPVAELLPELARAVGVLDAQTVHGGYRLVTAEGRRLSGEAGLTFQGVEDGGVLTVAAGVDDPAPRVYDDIVEAMADAVETGLSPWQADAGRRTALSSAAVLLALGALALVLQRPNLVAGVGAGIGALLLVAGALVLARVQREPETATTLAWGSVVYAVVCGIASAPAGPLLELPVALAGAGAVVAGVIGSLVLLEQRTLLLPAIAVGAVFAAASGVLAVSDFRAASVYTVALVLAVLAGSALPWAALGSTRTRVEQAHSDAEITADPREIIPQAVRDDARLGHEVLLAITATIGLLLVLVSPLAVSLGRTGTLVAVAACLVIMLRTRQYRVGTEVGLGLLSGLAGLVAIVLSIIVLHAEWRSALAVLLAATGAVLLVLTLVPSPPSVRRGRMGDLAELLALVAMLPLLVFAIGLVGAVQT
jgi:type VII secretion integral membrane protein EccD